MADQGALPELSINSREGTLTGPSATVRLEPKVMGVLMVLAAHPGAVVSRDEIFREVWPDVVVTEHTLSRCIYQMRQAMKEVSGADEAQATIETLHKRGYRLLARVHIEGSALGTVTAVDLRDHPILAPPPAITDDRSIAVLPFVDMSEAGDQDYFAEGIAEELINGLTGLNGLRVIARTSSFRFKGTNHDIASIGQQLNVATVLEGSVRSSGTRLRLTVQLVDVSNNSHLWSERYDRELGEMPWR
jgi:TolB-like protein